MKAALPLLVLCSVAACADAAIPDPAASYALTLSATGEEHDPLSGVRVFAGDELLGATEEDGNLQLELQGVEGERVPLRIECPESFRSPPQPLVVGLWQPGPGSPAPTFEVECVPFVHSYVVGISAENGAHLPISYLNEPVGETDDFGVAHVVLRAPSQEQVSLTLDTSERPELRPQSPSLAFVAGESSELVLLQVKFVEPPRPVRTRRVVQGPIELKH
ncbi:MAG TPA: hypothetical protein VFS67_18810 [Polyangiaceae bacterium]|nr:hypothetical protein [Polyangiaceae bacterium]